METTTYYVVRVYGSNLVLPSIVETFNSLSDAETYVALMYNAKREQYIVLVNVEHTMFAEPKQ